MRDRYGQPRALSRAEEMGWRRFWDGWVICPPCMAGRGWIGGPYTPQTWRVPAHYDTPIKPTDRCSRCGLTPLQVAPPLPALEAAVLEMFAHG